MNNYILGLCDNRNFHITIMLLDITIITIVDPLLYVCMKFTKTLLNTPIIFFIICYPLFPVLSWYAVNHIYLKTLTLIAYFSTKSKTFTVIKCYFTAITCLDNENFYYHDNDNIYHCDNHTFSIIAQHYYIPVTFCIILSCIARRMACIVCFDV